MEVDENSELPYDRMIGLIGLMSVIVNAKGLESARGSAT